MNGDIITQTELEERQIGLLQQRGIQLRNDAELARALEEVTPEVISGAVDELLLMQRARELGYQFTDEQFDEILGELMTENGFETEEEFRQALQQGEGMTIEDLRRVMERQILINQVQQIEVLGSVTLTEVEAREYYEANVEQYTEPATVTMREILVRLREGLGGVGVAADDMARADAEEARQRVIDGEDFELVAVAASDAASKANGGLIGPIELSLLSSTLLDVLAELEVGDMSEPIRTPLGLPGPETRSADRAGAKAVRGGPRADFRERVQRPTHGRVRSVPRSVAHRSRLRVEERFDSSRHSSPTRKYGRHDSRLAASDRSVTGGIESEAGLRGPVGEAHG